MFKEIKITNTYEEEKAFLLNTDNIAFIREKHVEPTRLYDEEGNLVKEELPTEKVFELVLVLENGHHVALTINETTYNEIVKIIVK